jgi:hypothetical protein
MTGSLPKLAGLLLGTTIAILLLRIEAKAQNGSFNWESPQVIFDVGSSGSVFNPFVIEDSTGTVYVLWEVSDEIDPSRNGIYCVANDGLAWLQPVDVLVAPNDGRTFWPRHFQDDQGIVHLVWVGPNGTLYYSRANSEEVCQARAWETTVIPSPYEVLYGDIAVDRQSNLHVAYSVSGNNVYYLQSSDGGVRWSDPLTVSSVQQGVATSFPSIAVDQSGRIHVTWEEGTLPTGLPDLGQYYAMSSDFGQTWSIPLQLIGGGYTQPNVAALEDGSIHLIWNGRIGTRGRYHQWSVDGGMTWSDITEFLPKSLGGGQTGTPSYASDSAGSMYVVTGNEDTTIIQWDGRKWLTPTAIMSFEQFGNMEHQNITISRGHIFHVVANGNNQVIAYIRGENDAPEIIVENPSNTPTAETEPDPVSVTSADANVSPPVVPTLVTWTEQNNPPSSQTSPARAVIVGAGSVVGLMIVLVLFVRIRNR